MMIQIFVLALIPLGHAPQALVVILTSLVFITDFETHFQVCSGTVSSGHRAGAEHHRKCIHPHNRTKVQQLEPARQCNSRAHYRVCLTLCSL